MLMEQVNAMTEYMILVGAGERKDETSLPYKLIQPNLKPGDTVRFINYPASIGPVNSAKNPWGVGMDQSLAAGERALQEAVRATPNVPVLVGYSLGAYVLSNYLENRYKNKRFDEEIKYAMLIASPRASNRYGREGIAGAHGNYGDVSYLEVSNWDDGISSTPTNSVLKKLPKLVSYITSGGREVNQIFWFLVEYNYPPTVQDYFLLTGYMNGTQHLTAYLGAAFKEQIRKAMA